MPMVRDAVAGMTIPMIIITITGISTTIITTTTIIMVILMIININRLWITVHPFHSLCG